MHHTFYSENTVTLVLSPNSPQPMQGREEMWACSSGSRRRESGEQPGFSAPLATKHLLNSSSYIYNVHLPISTLMEDRVNCSSCSQLRAPSPRSEQAFLSSQPLSCFSLCKETLSSGRTFPVYLSPSKR